LRPSSLLTPPVGEEIDLSTTTTMMTTRESDREIDTDDRLSCDGRQGEKEPDLTTGDDGTLSVGSYAVLLRRVVLCGVVLPWRSFFVRLGQ
jgi:hypothetical protein